MKTLHPMTIIGLPQGLLKKTPINELTNVTGALKVYYFNRRIRLEKFGHFWEMKKMIRAYTREFSGRCGKFSFSVMFDDK